MEEEKNNIKRAVKKASIPKKHLRIIVCTHGKYDIACAQIMGKKKRNV